MSKIYKFEGTIWFPGDHEIPDEEFMDLTAFYYGDKHQDFIIEVMAGTIEEYQK